MTYRDREDFAKETGPTERTLRGMIRRMVITLTDKVLWQLLGQRGGQGGDEVIDVEVFPGIGFFARPPASGKPEAIVAAIAGAAKARVAIATRDEKTRQEAVAALPNGELGEGEVLVYTPVALIHVRANSTVEIRTLGGTAEKLPTWADFTALRTWIQNTMVIATPSGNSTPGTTTAPPTPAGTTVLKAQ